MKTITLQIAEAEEMDIGRAIVEERKRKGISQGDLCRKTMMERSYLSRLERGLIPLY